MKKEIALRTLLNTAVAALYIFLISMFMQYGSKIFGEKDNLLSPFIFLLIFCFSAAVVGSLIFGYSILLFFDDKKKEGFYAALMSVLWLGLFTAFAIVAFALLGSRL